MGWKKSDEEYSPIHWEPMTEEEEKFEYENKKVFDLKTTILFYLVFLFGALHIALLILLFICFISRFIGIRF